MKRDLMKILACPICKNNLKLIVREEDEEEVITGALCCESCDRLYPILDAVPNLLPEASSHSSSGV